MIYFNFIFFLNIFFRKMNIIKYFICLLLIIIKIDCSLYNHLDIQLLLILIAEYILIE